MTPFPLFQPCLTEKIKEEWTSTSLLGCGNISQTGRTSSGPTTGTTLALLIRTSSDNLWLDLVSSKVCVLFIFWLVEGCSCLWECRSSLTVSYLSSVALSVDRNSASSFRICWPPQKKKVCTKFVPIFWDSVLTQHLMVENTHCNNLFGFKKGLIITF